MYSIQAKHIVIYNTEVYSGLASKENPLPDPTKYNTIGKTDCIYSLAQCVSLAQEVLTVHKNSYCPKQSLHYIPERFAVIQTNWSADVS